MIPHWLRTLILVGCICSLGSATGLAQTLDPDQPLAQYLIRNWTTEDGLPRNNVLTGAQTTDGYLWFGGYAGLVRFDGVQFQVYNSHNQEAFASNAIYEVYADRQNRLWIGTQAGGLVVYEQGAFRRVFTDSALASINVFALTPDADGGIWLATSVGVLKYTPGEVKSFPELAPIADMTLSDIAVDGQGQVWIGTTGDGLYRFAKGQLTAFGEAQGLTSEAIYSVESRGDTILVGTLNSIALLNAKGTLLEQHSNERNQPSRSLGAALLDDRGVLWVGGQDGLGRYTHGQWNTFIREGAKLFNEVSDVFYDNQGNLWVATYREGIWQVANSVFMNYSADNGLHSGIVHAALGEKDVTWLGTESGLWEMRKGTFTQHTWAEDNLIRSLLRTRDGRLWLGTYGGLIHWDNGVKKQYGPNQGLQNNQVRDLAEDADGRLWIATRSGLYTLQGDSIFIHPGLKDLTSEYILSLLVDSQQRLWVGTNGKGAYCWDGSTLRHFTQSEGLGNNFVFRMTEGPQGGIWMGTTGGLTRYWGDSLSNLGGQHGLPSEVLFQPIRQGDRLWAVTDINLWSCNFADLHALLNGEQSTLPSMQILDKYDGLLGEEPTSVSESSFSPNNELIFCMPAGISVLNLAKASEHKSPAMLIHLAATDQARLHQPREVVLAPGNRTMTVFFTAFDYRAPEALSFQYRLSGFDETWQDLVGGRYATYTNLNPGSYEFQLRVARSSGQWSEEKVALAVRQEAYFYQTNAFMIIAAAIFIVFVVGVAYTRNRLLRLRNRRLEQLVQERTFLIEKQRTSIEKQAETLIISNEKITSSIRYARRIQDALLPGRERLASWFPESFILYLPKDVVSGDFYWIVEKDHKLFVAAVDCTGHGVPGAFMSVLGNSLLTQIVMQQDIENPKDVLLELHQQTVLQLQSNEDNSANRRDGMDLALVVIDKKEQTLSYAGAKRPLVYLKGDTLHTLKGDRFSIGDRPRKGQKTHQFTQHELPLADITQFFLFSDGYADQFGGKENRKFMIKRLYRLFMDLRTLPAAQQKQELAEQLSAWMGKSPQIDDILVMGIRLK